MSLLRRLVNEHLRIFGFLTRWLLIVAPLAAVVGSACALLLWLLDHVTALREQNGWLLFLLPLAGATVAILYRRLGHGAGGGNDLVMDEIHEPGAVTIVSAFRADGAQTWS